MAAHVTTRRAGALLLVLPLALAACGGSGSTSGPATGTPAPVTGSAAVDRYGYGPTADGSVTYQPDVVLIGGGPEAIRSVSPDGLTWTFDPAAAGIDGIEPGKVLFASSDAVGRVATVDRGADAVAVTLRPVALTEVVKNGHFTVDQPVSLDALSIAEIPFPADAFEDVQSSELTSEVPNQPSVAAAPAALARFRGSGSSFGEPEPVVPNAAGEPDQKSTSVGDWTVTGYRSGSTLGLRGERTIASTKPVKGSDLQVALDAHLETQDLRVVADIPVIDGSVGTSHFRILGITGLAMSVQAGVVNGLSDNRKAKIEIPIQLRQRLILGGFPATLTQKFKFLVQTAFTAKNGNITASAAWDVDGSLGIDGQTVTLPTLTAREPKLIDTISGVSVGVNGIVVAVSFEFGLTIGLPYAGAGPVAKFITSLGLTNGSSLGIVQCKQASITSNVTAGVSLEVFDPVKIALKKLAGYELPEETTLLSKPVIEERWVKPDVTACR